MHEVMEFAREKGIPKVVFTSSSRVLSPERNPYTADKIYGEEKVKGYFGAYGIEYSIIRPSTVYGPFNDLSKRLMDIWCLNALQGKDLKIMGDENKTLDFTYVDDFVDAIMLGMVQRNEDYDLSYGQGEKLSEVADYIIKLAGQGRKVFVAPEVAQPQEVQLDISKIKALGYEPKVDIWEGAERTFGWYKDNFDAVMASRK